MTSTLLDFLVTPSSLLAGLALVGLMGSLWRPRLGVTILWIAVLGLAVAGFSPLANWMLLPLEQRFPRWRETGQPVDGIILLSGALEPSRYKARRGFPLNESAERFAAFLDLAQRYPDARLVVTGGALSQFGRPLPEAELTAALLERLGVPRTRLLIEPRSRTTAENAREVAALIETPPGKRWLLVTSAWHMPRAIGSFRHAGLTVTPYPVDYRTLGHWDRRQIFLKFSTGLQRTDLAAHEWAGLIAYRLFGHSDSILPASTAEPDRGVAAYP